MVAVNTARSHLGARRSHFQPDSTLLVEWVGLVSIVGFAAMGVDKMLAVGRLSRVSERTLWATALLGGFLGIFLGASVFHHKTSKGEFWPPVVVSAILWAALLVLLTRPHLF